jgi:hypothetical protein
MAWGAQLLRVLDGYAIPDDCKKTPRRVLLTNLHTWDYRPAAPNPRLQDDLTERIFIAYHALKQIHVKKTRDLIAKKLNSLGAPPNQTDAKSGSAWGEPEVNSRVMQFRKVLLAEAPKRNTEEPTKFVAARTAQMVAVAVSGWAFHREVEESNRLRSSQSAPADQGHRGG